MKLLVDNQLPLTLALHLRSWGLDCQHVLECGLDQADDVGIWTTATAENQIVVSKDEDFILLAARVGDRGRLIWVRLGNCRNLALLAAFDRSREALLAALAANQRVVEIR